MCAPQCKFQTSLLRLVRSSSLARNSHEEGNKITRQNQTILSTNALTAYTKSSKPNWINSRFSHVKAAINERVSDKVINEFHLKHIISDRVLAVCEWASTNSKRDTSRAAEFIKNFQNKINYATGFDRTEITHFKVTQNWNDYDLCGTEGKNYCSNRQWIILFALSQKNELEKKNKIEKQTTSTTIIAPKSEVKSH